MNYSYAKLDSRLRGHDEMIDFRQPVTQRTITHSPVFPNKHTIST
ncbi:hypothetical protein ACKLNO_11320 [Neisseriaceae bacterium B1]